MSTSRHDWKPGDRFECEDGELRTVLAVRNGMVYYWCEGEVRQACRQKIAWIPPEAWMEEQKRILAAKGQQHPRCTDCNEPAIREFATKIHLKFMDL